MKLKDIMTKDVEVISPDCTIKEAAETMAKLDIGAVPLCKDGKLVGMVTDRDIAVKAVAKGLDLEASHVDEIVTGPIVWVLEDSDVEEATKLMREKKVRRLAVISHDRKLVGMVSIGDIALGADDQEGVGETLSKISEPAA